MENHFTKSISKLGSKQLFVYTKLDSDNNLDQKLSIVPSHGASIISLFLHGKSLLNGYGDDQELLGSSFFKSSILAPFPNRLNKGRFDFDGKSYEFPINDTTHSNAIHGFVFDRPFAIVEENLGTDLSISLKYSYFGELAYYPFSFSLQVSYVLKKDSFAVQFLVENIGSKKMPFGLGWHPYFSIENDSLISTSQLQQVDVDQRMLPTGGMKKFHLKNQPIQNLSLDTCFKLGNLSENECCQISRFSAKNKDYKMIFSAIGTDFKYLQIFNHPDGESIAVEPMTCNIDAFNNKIGLLEIEKGETKRIGIEIKCIEI